MCSKECSCCANSNGCLAGYFDGDEYYSPAPAYLVIGRIYFNAYKGRKKEMKCFLIKEYGIDYDKMFYYTIEEFLKIFEKERPIEFSRIKTDWEMQKEM